MRAQHTAEKAQLLECNHDQNFRNKHQSTNKVASNCIKFLVAHHEYLPSFIKINQCILEKLRIDFRN